MTNSAEGEDTGCVNVINRPKRHMIGVEKTI